jgi:glycerol-1-phosphate dehydrogenase [NAD(P)+]
MEHHTHEGVAPSHGFKVGVATLAVTRLYEQLLAFPMASLDVDACVARWPEASATEAEIQRVFAGSGFTATALKETQAKHIAPAALHPQLKRLREVWPQLQARLRAQLMPSAELECRLEAVGAPTTPEAIGLTRERLRASFVRAYHIRRRFTVLDVARRTGLLDRLLAGLFGPGAVWDLNAPAPRPSVA